MAGDTKRRLVRAASDLLDRGGQSAVALRAVADLVRVSHSAPSRHVRDRDALLTTVAEQDPNALGEALGGVADARAARR